MRWILLGLPLLFVVPQAAATFVAEVAGTNPDANATQRSQPAKLAYLDANGNGRPDRIDPKEPLYLDMDASATISYGDVGILPGAFASDAQVPAPAAIAPAETADDTPAVAAQPTDSWRSLDWILVAPAVANLGGLAMLARAQWPRNPFK